MFKSKPEYTISDATRAIDDAIAKAQAGFVNAHVLIDLLESRLAAIRYRQAMAYSVAPSFVRGNLP